MKQVNLKKYLLPNLPYVLIALYATKLGQAWRLAPGADASAKLLGLLDGFAAAFQSALPSFHPLDLLVGLCCGAALRLAVYVKGKNAKKYRKGAEYGSARWGTREDIRPFADPIFENNVILTATESLTMNNRPKDPKTARNKNVLVIGGSGSGKTRFVLKPNLMQCDSEKYPCSFVVTDPKGSVVIECGKMLRRKGYRIKIMNTINFKKSHHYNPFSYIHSEKDILKLVNCLMVNTKGEGKSGDDFWQKAETLLYTALIALLRDWFPPEDYNLSGLLTLLSLAEAREDDENFKSPLDLLFLQIEDGKRYIRKQGGPAPTAASGPTGLTRTLETGSPQSDWSWEPSRFRKTLKGADGRPKLDAQGNPIIVEPAKCGGLSPDEDFALMNYKNFKVAAGKTLKSIIISCNGLPPCPSA